MLVCVDRMLIAAALGVWLLGALREMHVWNPTSFGGRLSARREGVACRPSPYAEQSADRTVASL